VPEAVGGHVLKLLTETSIFGSWLGASVRHLSGVRGRHLIGVIFPPEFSGTPIIATA